MTLLAVADITAGYGNGPNILNGLSLNVEEGKVHCIIGPNGAGKTTLFNMISGTYLPTEGHITVDGVDTATMSPEDLRRGLGYAIQSVGLFPHLTVLKNITLAPIKVRKKNRQEAEEHSHEDGHEQGGDDGQDLVFGHINDLRVARCSVRLC